METSSQTILGISPGQEVTWTWHDANEPYIRMRVLANLEVGDLGWAVGLILASSMITVIIRDPCQSCCAGEETDICTCGHMRMEHAMNCALCQCDAFYCIDCLGTGCQVCRTCAGKRTLQDAPDWECPDCPEDGYGRKLVISPMIFRSLIQKAPDESQGLLSEAAIFIGSYLGVIADELSEDEEAERLDFILQYGNQVEAELFNLTTEQASDYAYRKVLQDSWEGPWMLHTSSGTCVAFKDLETIDD